MLRPNKCLVNAFWGLTKCLYSPQHSLTTGCLLTQHLYPSQPKLFWFILNIPHLSDCCWAVFGTYASLDNVIDDNYNCELLVSLRILFHYEKFLRDAIGFYFPVDSSINSLSELLKNLREWYFLKTNTSNFTRAAIYICSIIEGKKKFTLQQSNSTVQSSSVGVTRKSNTGAASKFRSWIFGSAHLHWWKNNHWQFRSILTIHKPQYPCCTIFTNEGTMSD